MLNTYIVSSRNRSFMDLETCGLSGSFVFLSFSLSSFSASVSFSFRNVAERRLESKLIPKWRSTGEIQLFAENFAWISSGEKTSVSFESASLATA